MHFVSRGFKFHFFSEGSQKYEDVLGYFKGIAMSRSLSIVWSSEAPMRSRGTPMYLPKAPMRSPVVTGTPETPWDYPETSLNVPKTFWYPVKHLGIPLKYASPSACLLIILNPMGIPMKPLKVLWIPPKCLEISLKLPPPLTFSKTYESY